MCSSGGARGVAEQPVRWVTHHVIAWITTCGVHVTSSDTSKCCRSHEHPAVQSGLARWRSDFCLSQAWPEPAALNPLARLATQQELPLIAAESHFGPSLAGNLAGVPMRARFPRKARPDCATGADLLLNFPCLRVRSAESVAARSAFVKTRYSGLTGHDDGQHGDDAGLAGGEMRGRCDLRRETCRRMKARRPIVARRRPEHSRGLAKAGRSD